MKTMLHLEDWIEIVHKHDKTLPMLLVGSKADLKELISIDDEYAREKREEHGFIDYIKTSAKTDRNVDKAFEHLVLEMLHRSGKKFLSSIKKKYDYFSSDLL